LAEEQQGDAHLANANTGRGVFEAAQGMERGRMVLDIHTSLCGVRDTGQCMRWARGWGNV
jgi:hypothetical protein